MNLFEHDELKGGANFNFAPMIDFLFLMLALFATLAISRASLFDSEVTLVEIKQGDEKTLRAKADLQQINLSINAEGRYKWLTEFEEYPMEDTLALQKELMRQVEIGVLPQDKSKTEVLLHIDQKAPWKPIAEAIFAVRELGFNAHPVYTPSE